MDVNEVVDYVKANMLGRIADEQNNTALMAETTLCDGDHLEIGTLHGGSAIVVALLKKMHGYSGRVVCVDPLDGYYGAGNDPITGVSVSLEVVRENARRFGVELEIIPAKSHPFPLYLHSRTFATAYIDGDHTGDAPLTDFINACIVTTRFITFDNCGAKWKDVERACAVAESVWQPHKREGITCVVRRP